MLHLVRPRVWTRKPPEGTLIKGGHAVAGGLAGAWMLNEGRGLAQNLGKYPNAPGTLTGGSVVWTTALHGYAAKYTATSNVSYVSIPQGPYNYERTQPFSIECLMYYVGAAETVVFSNVNSPNGDTGIALVLNRTAIGADSFALRLISPGGECCGYSATALTANNWYHLVVTYDGSSAVAGLKFYINGALQTTNSNSDTLGTNSIVTSNISAIGRYGALSFGGSASGTIYSHLRIWERILGSEEVKSLWADPYGMFNSPSRPFTAIPEVITAGKWGFRLPQPNPLPRIRQGEISQGPLQAMAQAEVITPDKWYTPQSQPVLRPPSRFSAIASPPNTSGETITPGKWGTSAPQQFLIPKHAELTGGSFAPRLTSFAEAVSADKFDFQGPDLHLRFKRGEQTGQAFQPRLTSFFEAVFSDKFGTVPPHFFRPLPAPQITGGMYPLQPLVQSEVITSDKWGYPIPYQQWPKRTAMADSALQPQLILFSEAITLDKWGFSHTRPSRPLEIRAGLFSHPATPTPEAVIIAVDRFGQVGTTLQRQALNPQTTSNFTPPSPLLLSPYYSVASPAPLRRVGTTILFSGGVFTPPGALGGISSGWGAVEAVRGALKQSGAQSGIFTPLPWQVASPPVDFGMSGFVTARKSMLYAMFFGPLVHFAAPFNAQNPRYRIWYELLNRFDRELMSRFDYPDP